MTTGRINQIAVHVAGQFHSPDAASSGYHEPECDHSHTNSCILLRSADGTPFRASRSLNEGDVFATSCYSLGRGGLAFSRFGQRGPYTADGQPRPTSEEASSLVTFPTLSCPPCGHIGTQHQLCPWALAPLVERLA